MSFEKVLIIEDEPIVRRLLVEIFTRRKFIVTSAENLGQVEAILDRESFDLVMLDIRLPDGNGLHFLERLTLLPTRPVVVMVTGNGSIESAVASIRAGAFDYVLKPFTPSQIDIIIKKAQSYRQLLQVNQLLSDQAGEEAGTIIGHSPIMQRLRQLIERVAPTDATVLITGENGTGKEVVARELYRRSTRRQNPFIKVNCAAVSESLMESEFFGHERGSFTGATERREGRFELANHGTLLLDEISEIPPNLQAKLLRVLQEREFERVGGNRTIKVNVRIVATSNRDLISLVEKGAFRQDLYYRLNVFPVHVPALRDRVEEILPLAEHFLSRYMRKLGVKVVGFSESARSAMLAYRWPGNVRELQNTIERAIILTEEGRMVSAAAMGLPTPILSIPNVSSVFGPGDIHEPLEGILAPEDRFAEAAPVFASAPLAAVEAPVLTIAELEKQAILSTLERTGGNRTKAAELLGISIRTLRNKLQEYRGSEGKEEDWSVAAV